LIECTGTNKDIHGIHQISGKIIIEGETKETFDYKVQPAFGSIYDPKALEVCGLTENEIKSYTHMHVVYPLVLAMLCRYIDLNDDKDKFFIVGYNVYFDAGFLGKWFKLNNGIKFFKQLFWFNVIDVMILASNHLMYKRPEMENFKQGTVAKFLGIKIDDAKLHDGEYDINVCHQIYDIVGGKY